MVDVDSTTKSKYVTEASVRWVEGERQLNQSQVILSGRGVNWDYWGRIPQPSRPV